MPTEEEWEFAARGGEKATDYSWGNDAAATQQCWNRTQKEGTCDVGSFPAGAFGLFDMNGNVWNWTSSGHGDLMKVFKGGTWSDSKPVRSATRREANQPAFAAPSS